MKNLLKEGIFFKDYRDGHGFTMIYYAAILDDPDLTKILLNFKCNPKIKCGEDDNTALHVTGFKVF